MPKLTIAVATDSFDPSFITLPPPITTEESCRGGEQLDAKRTPAVPDPDNMSIQFIVELCSSTVAFGYHSVVEFCTNDVRSRYYAALAAGI